MFRTLPLYQATQSLETLYKFKDGNHEDATVTLPAASIHSMLYGGCESLFQHRQDLRYTKDMSDVNLATAALTLLYTDTSTEEGYLGEDIETITFALKADKTKNILSVTEMYDGSYSQLNDVRGRKIPKNKQIRNQAFNHMLDNNIQGFSQFADKYHIRNLVASRESLQENILNSNFHEKFHHSEEGMLFGFSSEPVIEEIVAIARKERAGYFYGLVLDVYSQRTLCGNCNLGLIGITNTHESGFLFDLSAQLEKKQIEPKLDKKLLLDVRVTASSAHRSTKLEPYKLCKDQGVVHVVDNQLHEARPILQALNPEIREENVAPPHYHGNFFSSRSFSKKRLEETLSAANIANAQPIFNKPRA